LEDRLNPNDDEPIRVADMIRLMETVAPPFLAESWDNCGLQAGDLRWPVNKVTIALDPLFSVIQSAMEQGIDMVITHHPLIFTPLRKIDLNSGEGRVIATALKAQIAIYAAHTNLDSACEGINDLLSRTIGLDQLIPMVPSAHPADPAFISSESVRAGMGRYGVLAPSMSVAQLARKIKQRLGLKQVRVAGRSERLVRKAAVCSGSGASLLAEFMASEADVFISGDFRYHDARSVEDAGRALIDIGHFASEHIIVEALHMRMKQAVAERGWRVEMIPCRIEQDPFEYL
jgi:dinuclear metal center YbgI/SA1388 family protein